MASSFKNATILLPAMDETYSLRQTVDEIVETNNEEDIAEFIFLLCDKTTSESRAVAEELVRKYEARVPIYIHNQTLPFVGGAIREGISLAQGSHVVMMSSDLETDPDVIKDFIAHAKAYPDHIITATRWKKGGGFKSYNKVKLVCNLCLLIDARTLDFADFSRDIWYNFCKGFNKTESFSLQIFEKFNE